MVMKGKSMDETLKSVILPVVSAKILEIDDLAVK